MGVAFRMDTCVDVTVPYPVAENVNVKVVPASPFTISDEKSATPLPSVETVPPDNVADPDVAVRDAVTDTPAVDETFPDASINCTLGAADSQSAADGEYT